VAPLKASVVFLADLSRALRIPHGVDFLELASYAAGADSGGHARIRLLKDLDTELAGRHVIVVEDVVDTGLTLNYLCKTLALRDPASLAAVTLLDRPYRRLVEDLRSLGLRLEIGGELKPVEGPLSGNTYVITGTLENFTRDEAAAALEAQGAKVVNSVSGKTTGLIVGEEPGNSKLAKARKVEVPLLTEQDLVELLGG